MIKMIDLKDEVKRVVDTLIDSSLMKDCVEDVAILKCCKELNIKDFTARRIIDALKWKESYYYSPRESMLKRLG